MYKYVGSGLLTLFVLMIIPAGISTDNSDGKFWGGASMVVHDVAGNELFSQLVHNQLVDEGETYILQQVFREGGASDEGTDANQIAAICIDDAITVAETLTAAGISAANNGLGTAVHCVVDAAASTASQGTAVIEVTFTGGTHLTAGQTIAGIGICEGNGGTDYQDCADANTSTGILFAAVDTSDVTLGAGETATFTYTFDMTSGGS